MYVFILKRNVFLFSEISNCLENISKIPTHFQLIECTHIYLLLYGSFFFFKSFYVITFLFNDIIHKHLLIWHLSFNCEDLFRTICLAKRTLFMKIVTLQVHGFNFLIDFYENNTTFLTCYMFNYVCNT